MKCCNIMISAAVAALMLVVAAGCKPTEKNYKAAYDAAVQKRQQAADEQMRPATGLLSDDGPQRRVVDGDTVYVLRERILALDGSALSGKWGVAVGVFKIDTNAKAAASDLRGQGCPGAIPAKARGGKFYTLAATVATLDSAKSAAADFSKRFKEYPYVGLPGAPVLINY